ncbi:MAG: ribonuclease catalytic domain-containing protein [Thermodesulfobacteriota bacterium]
MEPGYLIEFFEEKRLLCAVVLELKGERLHVLTQTSREMTVARKRILHAGPGPFSLKQPRQKWLELLADTDQKREALKDSINLEELWELLAQEDKSLTVEELTDLWFGGASPDQVAAMGRALYEDRFLFKYKEGRWVPNPPEVVANLQEKVRREEAARQELEAGAGWLKTAWETGAIPDDYWRQRLVELLRQMAVWGTEAPEFPQGKAFLEKARLTAEDAPFRLLVRLGVFHEDENLDLYRLEVPQEFSAPARNLAAHLSQGDFPDPYAPYRQDLADLECITIDGERTRDFDDALSLETLPQGWRLGIHIADVSALVTPGTPLDLEAQERGTSIYLPEVRLAMLPEEISENTLSLLAQKERLALSFLVDLDARGEVRDWEILPSRITVKRRLSYQEVDRLLPQDRMLATLYNLTQKLKEDRLAKGGYELKLPEVWVSFNHHGQIQLTVEDQETPSRKLVAEAMVLANWLAARFLADRNFPAIYRSQPEPREPINREEPKELLGLWQDRRRLSRVVMELVPQPHWGLGLPLYTFATSPIRRYLDLVIHRQLHRALQGAAPVYESDDLEEILTNIEPAMRRAGLLKARRLRYWLLKYLAGQVGQKMEALVVEALPHRYRLLFPQLLLEVFLPTPASLRLYPGDLVQVRLDRVLPREDQVKLSLA